MSLTTQAPECQHVTRFPSTFHAPNLLQTMRQRFIGLTEPMGQFLSRAVRFLTSTRCVSTGFLRSHDFDHGVRKPQQGWCLECPRCGALSPGFLSKTRPSGIH